MGCQLILSDIDGCLCPEDSIHWELPGFTKLAQSIQSANNGSSAIAPLTLCSGRPQPYMEVLVKLFGIRHPVICENGAVFYTLSDNKARYAQGITSSMIAGIHRLSSFIEEHILPAFPGVVLQFGKQAQISVYSPDPSVFKAIDQLLQEYIRTHRDCPDLIINASHFYMNISLKGFDKGKAIRQLLSELNLSKADCAGIGDTVGDLPLRDSVAFFACPSNAQEAVKKAADYVSPFPLAAGVCDILSRPQFQRHLPA